MGLSLFNLKTRVQSLWASNSKFTIHPFKSLHSRHLLPLSISDYTARFSLEIVLLSLTTLAIWVNIVTITHASQSSSTDQSVLFSYLKTHPEVNPRLVASVDTTIITQTDELIHRNAADTMGVVLAASQSNPVSSKTLTASTIQGDVIVKTNPADTQGISRNGFTTYKVRSGDTLAAIASSYGISPQTIMLENKINTESSLRAGTTLTILPTTGISHSVTDGDTMESIIAKYKVDEIDFLDANNIESFEDLGIGAVVVIPMQNVTVPSIPKPASRFVVDDSNKVALKQVESPDLGNGPVTFIWPTTTKNITQGYSSRHTGLDISDSKLEPIYASAGGFVEVSGYQANGYGNTIIINHGNGYKTRYAHASELYVQAGDSVEQGQKIAKQGRTGRVRGVTGIHLHFEIMKNGKRINPLNYTRP